MFSSTSIFLCVLFLACSGIKLPDYFLRCGLSNPHFGQCIADSANIVIPKLINGNKDFNFSPINVFSVPDITSSPFQTTIKLKLTNVTAGKLEDARAVFATFDVQRILGNLTLYFPHFRVTGNYELDGNTKELTARGAGEADITFTDVFVETLWTFDIQIRDGKRHLNVLDTKVKYRINGAKYTFSGLFSGDEPLAKKASDQINNNWRVLEKLISPVVMESLRKIAYHYGKTVNDYVPVAEVFRQEL